MSRAVVHGPKDATSRFIRLLAHDFAHKPIHGSNSTFDFTAAEDSCSMDIPSCQIGPGSQAEVLMLEGRGAIGRRRQGRLFSAAGLNTGLFVCADDVIIGTQWSALPDALVKIEDRSGFASKVRIAGLDPASMFPGAKGVSSRDAITSLESPSSANRMILARITSQYGDVYFLAIDSSVCRSSLERFTLNGLFLGVRNVL
jgi:hypothetical protein